MNSRKAVSPVIATLLLIAIAVAAGILVYVFVNGLSSQLTNVGTGGVQDQVELAAYSFSGTSSVTFYLQNVGTSQVTVSAVYLNGLALASCGTLPTLTPQSTPSSVTCSGLTGLTSGVSYSLKVASQNGGIAVFSVTAGKSG